MGECNLFMRLLTLLTLKHIVISEISYVNLYIFLSLTKNKNFNKCKKLYILYKTST